MSDGEDHLPPYGGCQWRGRSRRRWSEGRSLRGGRRPQRDRTPVERRRFLTSNLSSNADNRNLVVYPCKSNDRLKPNYSELLLLSQSVIQLSLHSVLLSFSIRWPLEMSDYPLAAPRVFCDVNGGNRIQTGFT